MSAAIKGFILGVMVGAPFGALVIAILIAGGGDDY